jgi:heme exporter protein C
MGPKSCLLSILDSVTFTLVAAATLMVFFYAPLEVTMGQVQRVFYFHVATAWVGMLGFLAATVAAVAYLRTNDRQWDIVGLAAVEISLVFFLIAIVTGSIWAYPAWNTWWTWDVRLTTAAIVELVYAAYMMLRQGIEDPDKRARFGAVYAVVAFISVPLTFLSIRFVDRTIHPVVIGSSSPGATGQFSMTPHMLQTFLFSLVVFSVLFTDLFWHRIRLGRLAEKVEQLKLKVTE